MTRLHSPFNESTLVTLLKFNLAGTDGSREKRLKPIPIASEIDEISLDLDQVVISGLLQFQIHFESNIVDLLMNWKEWETKKEVKNGSKFWPEQIKQRMK